MQGIDLYKEVVINQNREYLGKEFKYNKSALKVSETQNGQLIILDIKEDMNINNVSLYYLVGFLHTNYEEVQKPVSFMEAWQHMKNGGKAECSQLIYILDGDFLKYIVSGAWNKASFCKYLIESDWYLLD